MVADPNASTQFTDAQQRAILREFHADTIQSLDKHLTRLEFVASLLSRQTFDESSPMDSIATRTTIDQDPHGAPGPQAPPTIPGGRPWP